VAPVVHDATSGTAEIVLDLPGFAVLAAAEYGGELEVLVETTATVADCPECGRRASGHGRREHLLFDVQGDPLHETRRALRRRADRLSDRALQRVKSARWPGGLRSRSAWPTPCPTRPPAGAMPPS
jgi:hypothetical protein